MRILLICGSRNHDGQTATAAKAAKQGFEDAGGTSISTFLPEMNIQHCQQCNDTGWGDCLDKGSCIIDDDFAGIVDKIRTSNALIIATPVYYSDLSETMRAFLNRLRRICSHENGRHDIASKPAIGITVAGGSGNGSVQCAISLERYLMQLSFDILDIIPTKRQNLSAKLEILHSTGQYMASHLKELLDSE